MNRAHNPRRTPRQTRSRALVADILSAAARVFDEKGFEAATTNEIARVAGVSVGSLYQYFPSKASLVTALHERHAEEMLVAVTNAIEAAGGAPLGDVIADVVRSVVRAHGTRPRLARLLHVEHPELEQAPTDSAGSRALAARVAAFLAGRASELGNRDPISVTYLMLHTVESLVHWSVLEADPTFDRSKLEHSVLGAALGCIGLRA